MGSERPEVLAGIAEKDCSGTTVLVTGSTSGLGRETALALGRLGATVLVHGRDEAAGKEVVDRIEATDGDAELFLADFAELANVKELAEAVTDGYSPDVLVNNAGGFFTDTDLTADGVEFTFQVNYLSPFYLTQLLLPTLQESDDPRIVNVSSGAHRGARRLDLDTVTTEEHATGWKAYSRSKLGNILFTYELADRLDNVPVNCLHPGFVPGSRFYRNFPFLIRALIRVVDMLPAPVSRMAAASVEDGASTIVYLAAAEEAQGYSGSYFFKRSPTKSSSITHDRELQQRLWDWSIEHTPLENEDVPDT